MEEEFSGKRSREESVETSSEKKRLKEAPKPMLSPPRPPHSRPVCQYGVNCYRRHPSHFKEFQHPRLEALFLEVEKQGKDKISFEILGDTFHDVAVLEQQIDILRDVGISQIIHAEKSSTTVQLTPEDAEKPSTSFQYTGCSVKDGSAPISAPEHAPVEVSSTSTATGDVLAKFSSKFNFFLTRLPREESFPHAVTFRELFHRSLGEVKRVLHFNFMVEADWFLEEIHSASLDGVDTTVVYGVESEELVAASRVFPWLKVQLVKSPFPFGHHHTKVMVIEYVDSSVRFIVSTANLIESDWANRTQGLWVSPKCPACHNGVAGDGPGKFKEDFLQYLSSYPSKALGSWPQAVRSVDASEIKVVFVGSAPTTSQSSTNGFQWGESKMESTWKRYAQPEEVEPMWPLLIQCSSIGSLGQSDEWVRGELGLYLMGKNNWSPSTPVRIIFPSDGNVRGCLEGVNEGGCLPYSRATHLKQQWIRKHFYLWKSDSLGRSRAMPHIKTYCRISPDQTKLGWFLLTSANLSKAAWGKINKKRDKLSVMSWEAGVLFIPKLFGFDEGFTIHKGSGNLTEAEFLLPYDTPVQKYGIADNPWHIDTLVEHRQTQNHQ